jgi:hypothetical protein
MDYDSNQVKRNQRIFRVSVVSLPLVSILAVIGIIVIIAGLIVRNTTKIKPDSSGYGYGNPKYAHIVKAISCRVVNPALYCKMQSKQCTAELEYKVPNKGSVTSTTFRTHNRDDFVAQFASGDVVPCYTDPFRFDIVNYYRYSNLPFVTTVKSLFITGTCLLIAGVTLFGLFGILLVSSAWALKVVKDEEKMMELDEYDFLDMSPSETL